MTVYIILFHHNPHFLNSPLVSWTVAVAAASVVAVAVAVPVAVAGVLVLKASPFLAGPQGSKTKKNEN